MHRTELPTPRGPLSTAVIDVLSSRRHAAGLNAPRPCDAYGDDLQLSLYVAYELHYRGFAGVDDELEWDPDLLRWRRELERTFLAALRHDVPGGSEVTRTLDALVNEPPDEEGASHHLLLRGERWQLEEYVVHRSLYHLKEADPRRSSSHGSTGRPRPHWSPWSTTSTAPVAARSSTLACSPT